MRYVPNLIPERWKVLPDYFKGNLYKGNGKQRFAVLSYTVAVICFVLALGCIIHPLLTLLAGLIGLLFLPPGHDWVERQLRFRLTTKIKSFAVTALFISFSISMVHYAGVDRKEDILAAAKKAAEERVRKQEVLAEKQRKDSLDYFLAQATNSEKSEKALQALTFAASFSPNAEEQTKIEAQRAVILLDQTIRLVKRGNYQQALPQLIQRLATNPTDAKLHFYRAVCFSKTGRIREAVADLDVAMESGNSEAKNLYEKINPVRRRVAYYVTRCCDGTTSSATGRGACSWHGGVCNWNDPVYEEYRKY